MELQKKKAEEEEAQSIQDDYDWKACRLNLNIYAINTLVIVGKLIGLREVQRFFLDLALNNLNNNNDSFSKGPYPDWS